MKINMVLAENISEETDYPNPELYPVRKRQLRKFVKVLREQKKSLMQL